MSGYVLVNGGGEPALSDVWPTEEGAEDALAYGIEDADHDGANGCPVAVRPVVAPERSRTVSVGDIILCRGLPVKVTGVAWAGPHRHAGLPIRDDYYAILVRTRRGNRYFGSPTQPEDSANGGALVFATLSWTAP